MATQFPITSGPSKWDLASGLFNRKPHHIVTFGTNAPVFTRMEIVVTSIQAQDDSGESWNIEGIVRSATRQKHLTDFFSPEAGQRVFIHFRTDNRQGYVRFFKKNTVSLTELDQMVREGWENERT